MVGIRGGGRGWDMQRCVGRCRCRDRHGRCRLEVGVGTGIGVGVGAGAGVRSRPVLRYEHACPLALVEFPEGESLQECIH